jgi:TctA family transporter
MEKKKYSYSPQYFTVMLYVAVILFLTSLALIYSCFRNQSFVYLAAGIIGFIIGMIGLIEVSSKKRIFPHGQYHRLREIIALVILAFGVYILRYGSLSGSLNWREKMVSIICFVLGVHALHLRGFLKAED